MHEAGLVAALLKGEIAGAALDVFEFEPEVHPALLELENVCLTPHIGGGTHESRGAARRLCAENVAAVLQGKPPLTPVNDAGLYVGKSTIETEDSDLIRRLTLGEHKGLDAAAGFVQALRPLGLEVWRYAGTADIFERE